MRKITLQIRLFMTFMFHLMLWKTLPMITNSLSNILNCSTLSDFLEEMTLIILNLDLLNGITLLIN